MSAERVHAAWCEWDDRPTAETTASRLTVEVAAFAAALHLDSNQIRRAMAAGRREGHARDVVLAGIEATAAERMTTAPKENPT